MIPNSVCASLDFRVLFGTLFLVIVMGSLGSGTSFTIQPAFADETVLSAADAPVMQGKGQEPKTDGEPSGEKKKDCVEDPVMCVGVDISQLSYPGCTSGQRCSLDTAGKICGQFPTRRCQTVNNNGACSCQCIR